MVEAFLWVLVLGYLLGWALESWSEKALVQDSESVLAQRGLVLAKVLASVLDAALLMAALLVLGFVLVRALV
jgi:hypothetical protein